MNAHALVGCGAGVRLLPEEITPVAVAGAVQALLDDPGYRQAARALADEIAAMPAPAATVRTLERLATQASGR